MSQQFNTTNPKAVEADYYEAKALSLAFAIVGRLIAEGFIQVDLGDKDWHVQYKHEVRAVADTVHEFVKGGF
jgi:hypothetical protein